MGVFLRPFNEASGLVTNILLWFNPSFYGGYAPFVFLGSWVLMALYLCFRFHTFDKPILEEYVS
jgi:hypothetical protein